MNHPSVSGSCVVFSQKKQILLIELHDFHGWTAGAMWEDIKFDFKYFHDIERIGVVGENKWEKGMTLFFKPFTAADVHFFASNRKDFAMKWIRKE